MPCANGSRVRIDTTQVRGLADVSSHSGTKAGAALGPTGAQDASTRSGRHSGAKPVLAFALEIARLIGALHDVDISDVLRYTLYAIGGILRYLDVPGTDGSTWMAREKPPV